MSTHGAAETSARAAAEAYVAGVAKGVPDAAHAEVAAFGVADGEIIQSPSMGQAGSGSVESILVLQGGKTAVAQVRWADRAGWLTLLIDNGGVWVVISDVTAPVAGTFTITPADMNAVNKACWEEYGGANRACDGARMAQVFHPVCRLTYSGPDGAVVIKPQDVFIKMVSERYTTPLHSPYAHLRDDPRVGAHDTMLGVTFATPDVAMVVLKVGHPPMLWTDVLTCARLAGGRWWIVAKSSSNEPLLANEAKE